MTLTMTMSKMSISKEQNEKNTHDHKQFEGSQILAIQLT